MFRKVTYHLEKRSQLRVKEAKMERILEPQLPQSWALHFKNKESFITKNNKGYKIDLRSTFRKISLHKILTASSKVRKI
jgi:hypothetical protein